MDKHKTYGLHFAGATCLMLLDYHCICLFMDGRFGLTTVDGMGMDIEIEIRTTLFVSLDLNMVH